VERERSLGRDLLVNLVVDEMKLHKQLFYNGNSFVGCVDLGDGSSSFKMETDAWVFMLVAVKECWKIPVAHFFINGLEAKVENGKTKEFCKTRLTKDD
jgi:hypothetical protein